MNDYRYQLEKYRGRSTRYTCPQCGRKYCFTRYIDTETNQYINDRVGKCNRLDKCGYHYTPRQYFEDNPWLKEDECPSIHYHRKNGWMDSGQTPPHLLRVAISPSGRDDSINEELLLITHC